MVGNRTVLWEVLRSINPDEGGDNPKWDEACVFAAEQVQRNIEALPTVLARLAEGRRIRNEWLATNG